MWWLRHSLHVPNKLLREYVFYCDFIYHAQNDFGCSVFFSLVLSLVAVVIVAVVFGLSNAFLFWFNRPNKHCFQFVRLLSCLELHLEPANQLGDIKQILPREMCWCHCVYVVFFMCACVCWVNIFKMINRNGNLTHTHIVCDVHTLYVQRDYIMYMECIAVEKLMLSNNRERRERKRRDLWHG